MDHDTPANDEMPKPPVPAPMRVAIGVALLAAFLFGIVMLISPPPPRTDAAGLTHESQVDLIGWHHQFTSVRQDGTPGNMQPKPVLMVFTADYCPPCQYMKNNVYTDPAIADLIREQFVPVMIDMSSPGTQEYELARFHRVEYLPTIVILDQAENEIVRGETMDANRMSRMLNAALTYIDHNPPRLPRRSRSGQFGFGFDRDNHQDAPAHSHDDDAHDAQHDH